MTRSGAPSALVSVLSNPIPSRMDLPPPNTISSPKPRRSFSISMYKSVSPSRTRSPVVGPKRLACSRREISAMRSCGVRSDRFESAFAQALDGTRRVAVGCTIDQIVEPVYAPRAAERDEVHGSLIAGLEANRRRRRNVEMHAERGAAIERERLVDFEKMKMRADLYRTIAGVANLEHLDRL